MKKKIYLDMDGTICDLYGVDEWLFKLQHEDASPYIEAKPLVNFSHLARVIHKLQSAGFTVGIISWLSKNGSTKYNVEVAKAKMEYLTKHLKSVRFDEIHIVAYGTPKCLFAPDHCYLFDDEEKNRLQWNGTAFDEKNLLEMLHLLLTKA
jgi:hypothetical protein